VVVGFEINLLPVLIALAAVVGAWLALRRRGSN
jgi:hypothetical protein